MSELPSCKTCRHASVWNRVPERATCRRRAPVGRPADHPIDIHNDFTFVADAIWPLVWLRDWCGEHSPRPEPESTGGEA